MFVLFIHNQDLFSIVVILMYEQHEFRVNMDDKLSKLKKMLLEVEPTLVKEEKEVKNFFGQRVLL